MEEQNGTVEEQPQEQAAPVEESATSEQEVEAQPAEDTAAQPEERPKGVQKRIDELTRNWRDTERDRDHWRAMAMQQQQAQAQPMQEEPAPVNNEPPTLEQFDYDEAKYLDALTDWKVEQKFNAKLEQARQHRELQQQQQEQYQRQQTVQQKLAEGAEKYPDFDQVVTNPSVPITPQMADALAYVNNAADVAYQLGSNPQEALRIAQLPPQQQALEVARIDARIEFQSKQTPTQAPPPINPVSGPSATPEGRPADIEAWMKARNAELRG